MKEQSFVKYDGRSTLVLVSNEREIGRGTYGTVFSTDVGIGKKVRKFAVKKYRGDFPTLINPIPSEKEKSAKKSARHAFNMYATAKQAGLKVPVTFRLGADGKSILMTEMGKNDTQLLDPQTFTEEKVNIAEQEHKRLLDSIYSHAVLAAEKGIYVGKDAYFFLYGEGSDCLDFIIGDFDGVETIGTHFSTPVLFNLSMAKEAVIQLGFAHYMKPEEYNRMAIGEYTQWKIAQGYSNY